MDQLFSIIQQKVSSLISKIETGELGVPDLQRPFIWENKKVRDLFDSMMKGFPIGNLMVWECPKLEKKKSIGVESHSYPEPREVIIDGQQRLTSLYAVFKGKKVYDKKHNEREIVISFNPLTCAFEVGNSATKQDKTWIYNISDAYTSSQYPFICNHIKCLEELRKAKGSELTEAEKNLIADNINRLYALSSYDLPVFSIKAEADEESVSNIFVRVNSGGVHLNQNDFILTLLSLYWPEGRKQIEDFAIQSTKPSAKPSSYNLLVEVEPSNLIRVAIAYTFNRAITEYGYKLLRGADLEKKGVIDVELRNQRFDLLRAKLPDVIDVHTWHEFLKCVMNAGYLGKEQIRAYNPLFAAYTLYLIAKHRFGASDNENMLLTSKWVFFASLAPVYSSSYESTMEAQLTSIKEMKTFEEFKTFLEMKISEVFTPDYFEVTLPGSTGLASSGTMNTAWNAYCASLNILDAHVLFSKSNLLVSKLYEAGADGRRKSLEKHHLFPKAFLRSKGYSEGMINQVANCAYIDWKDNMEILDKDPAVYYPLVCKGRTEQEILKMEEENALPHGWEKMAYEDFLESRRKLMANKIKEGLGKLNRL